MTLTYLPVFMKRLAEERLEKRKEKKKEIKMMIQLSEVGGNVHHTLKSNVMHFKNANSERVCPQENIKMNI